MRDIGNRRSLPGGLGSSAGAEPEDANIQSNIFMMCQGAGMLSSMTTGSRSNGYSFGDTIDNPAYAIEWILRSKLGLDHDAIDTASFDSVGNKTTGKRRGWKIASVFTAQRDAFDYIADICNEFSLMFITTANGKYKLVPMDSGSAVYTVATASIFYDGLPQISLATTPTENVCNNLIFHYRTDFSDNQTKSMRFIADMNADGLTDTNITGSWTPPRTSTYSSWMDDSIDRYRTTFALERTLNNVRDDTTAERVITKLADWLAFKRLIVRMKLLNTINTVKLEVGDIIKIDSELLGDSHQNTTGFIITRVNYPAVPTTDFTNYITIDCEEIPNGNTGAPVITSRFISSEDLAT